MSTLSSPSSMDADKGEPREPQSTWLVDPADTTGGDAPRAAGASCSHADGVVTAAQAAVQSGAQTRASSEAATLSRRQVKETFASSRGLSCSSTREITSGDMSRRPVARSVAAIVRFCRQRPWGPMFANLWVVVIHIYYVCGGRRSMTASDRSLGNRPWPIWLNRRATPAICNAYTVKIEIRSVLLDF